MTERFSLPRLDWSAYFHAYGNAGDVPVRWSNFLTHPAGDVQPDLPSAICHQGDVYSATWPLVPLLVEVALSHHAACASAAEVLGSILLARREDDANEKAWDHVAAHMSVWKTRLDDEHDAKSFAWLAVVVAAELGDEETVVRVRQMAKEAVGTLDEDYYEFVFWALSGKNGE